MKRQAYGFAAILSCCLLPSLALAQAPADDNLTERPNAAVCQVRYMDENSGAGMTVCLVLDPIHPAFLDQSTHFACQPWGSAGPAVTEHAIIVPSGGGNVKVWGVAIRTAADGTASISNPSEFWKECEDVPKRPIQLGGHPPLEDRIA